MRRRRSCGSTSEHTPRSTRRRSTAGRSSSPSPAGSCSARPRTGPSSSGAPDGASSCATATPATASVACRPSPFARSPRRREHRPRSSRPLPPRPHRRAPRPRSPRPVTAGSGGRSPPSCSWGGRAASLSHAAQELTERLLKNRPYRVRHWNGYGPAMAGVPRPRGGVAQHAPAFQPAHRPRLARRVPRRRGGDHGPGPDRPLGGRSGGSRGRDVAGPDLHLRDRRRARPHRDPVPARR